MADYAITGKKGSGKSLFAVGLVRDALRSGKRVATNLNVHLDKLLPPTSKSTYIRLPDRPTVADFEALGRGQAGVVEDDNGIILLDETSSFFNSRSFGDKARQPMLDWLIHSRKHGWDVYYIMQGLAQIDKQIRETQIEYHVPVGRTDKWAIPLISPLFKLVGLNVRFPKLHYGTIRQGIDAHAVFCERKWYRGIDLYSAYETQQIFLDREHPLAVGMYSALSAYHLKGRHMGYWELNKHLLFAGLAMGLILGLVAGLVGGYLYGRPVKQDHAVLTNIDQSVKVKGIVNDGNVSILMLTDGRLVPSRSKKTEGVIEYYLVGEKWIASGN